MILKKAYAKINLTLEILGKMRNDGFHDIASVMMKVLHLYDDVELAVTENGVSLCCDKSLCEDKDNLAYIAAKKYIDVYEKLYGKTFGVDIVLRKRIPSGAGLAGGSSDAAAVLDGLNELVGGISRDKIHEIALEIGSDVPFCLKEHMISLCTGRGEIITDLKVVPDWEIKVEMPATPLFTKGIYGEYDKEHGDDYTKSRSKTMAELINSGADLPKIAKYMCNDFQEICEKRCPEIGTLVQSLTSKGYFAQMSGSGSAVFGIKSK